ncbi:MerR family transcriptional regulator [Nocardia cyriacigeorgica]|uniref:MerR family transcriptional regulator n=1 Tax=Nocardia cyriacigeorgica TaxID=135487 RepID=A0A6P1D6P1_9NOCA|nr:MerR family transcriptional regulator [Nocardia cyriacigeorgica]NEW45044.1 MerR family transcriptional regulator [Nocardia cyriacigeorgica]
MRIGELSRRSGVSVRLLRYYEEQSMLAPERDASGYRRFQESDVGLVWQIRTLLAAGLSTDTIAQALPCICYCEGESRMVPSPELADGLRSERERIDRQIAALRESREILDSVIESAPQP